MEIFNWEECRERIYLERQFRRPVIFSRLFRARRFGWVAKTAHIIDKVMTACVVSQENSCVL